MWYQGFNCNFRKIWEGLRALRFHQKYLNLCSEDERRSYGFVTTWGWVINDRIFIFWRTIPLSKIWIHGVRIMFFFFFLIKHSKIQMNCFYNCIKKVWQRNIFGGKSLVYSLKKVLSLHCINYCKSCTGIKNNKKNQLFEMNHIKFKFNLKNMLSIYIYILTCKKWMDQIGTMLLFLDCHFLMNL